MVRTVILPSSFTETFFHGEQNIWPVFEMVPSVLCQLRSNQGGNTLSQGGWGPPIYNVQQLCNLYIYSSRTGALNHIVYVILV